jgi:hypothetical protein
MAESAPSLDVTVAAGSGATTLRPPTADSALLGLDTCLTSLLSFFEIWTFSPYEPPNSIEFLDNIL